MGPKPQVAAPAGSYVSGMKTSLGRAAFALALVSALAGQWLSAAPKEQRRFDVTILARVATAEPASSAKAETLSDKPEPKVPLPALKLGEPIGK